MKKNSIGMCLWVMVVYGAILSAQTPSSCPGGLPAGTSCFSGQDEHGAYYLIAIPASWNGMLTLFAHGGPGLEPPEPLTGAGALGPARTVWLTEGFAVAASSYRRGGFGVTMAAEDTEHLRALFVRTFGSPKRTLVHGSSYGGNVGAKLIELYGVDVTGALNYDGALLSCGILAGGSRAYYFRIDLRVVYQYYCRNHPRPDEDQYPFWMGLPPESTMTRQDLEARVNECTGYQLPPDQRSERQRQNLANILSVIRLPENLFFGHMRFGTFEFRDLVQRLGGRNPFPNRGVRYRGSTDDRALNRGVARYRSERPAVAQLAADADMTGEVALPIVTVHGIDDASVFVEHASAYRETLAQAGRLDYLFQTYIDTTTHCGYTNPEWAAVIQDLRDWIETGNPPTPAGTVAACEEYRAVYGGACRFNPTYEPGAWESRVYPRRP